MCIEDRVGKKAKSSFSVVESQWRTLKPKVQEAACHLKSWDNSGGKKERKKKAKISASENDVRLPFLFDFCFVEFLGATL